MATRTRRRKKTVTRPADLSLKDAIESGQSPVGMQGFVRLSLGECVSCCDEENSIVVFAPVTISRLEVDGCSVKVFATIDKGFIIGSKEVEISPCAFWSDKKTVAKLVEREQYLAAAQIVYSDIAKIHWASARKSAVREYVNKTLSKEQMKSLCEEFSARGYPLDQFPKLSEATVFSVLKESFILIHNMTESEIHEFNWR